jgi:uncharacterized membrane protein YoaT (DUF817 family)
MKHKLKVALGLTILPVFTLLYFADKFVLYFMPWKSSDTIQKWIYDPKKAAESLIRVIVSLILIGLYYLIANML